MEGRKTDTVNGRKEKKSEKRLNETGKWRVERQQWRMRRSKDEGVCEEKA